jgi:hypothetical protein
LVFKDYDFSMIIASKLFKKGSLLRAQAAETVGLSKGAFLDLIGKYGVSVLIIL